MPDRRKFHEKEQEDFVDRSLVTSIGDYVDPSGLLVAYCLPKGIDDM
jgi:hypothetical protein